MFLPVLPASPIDSTLRLPKAFLEFLSCFGGMRESPPYRTGHFTSLESLVTVAEALDLKRYSSFAPYAECFEIFYATNGDRVVMDRDGSLKWLTLAEGVSCSVARSFPDFMACYLKFRSHPDGHPFDSYGREIFE